MYTRKRGFQLGGIETDAFSNAALGLFAEADDCTDPNDPCAIPASQCCEDHHCPSSLSSNIPPFCGWACSEECRTYLRDKRSGSITTEEEINRAKAIMEQNQTRIRENRASRLKEEEDRKRSEEFQSRRRADEGDRASVEAKLVRNKKLVVIGAVMLVILGAGSFLLK